MAFWSGLLGGDSGGIIKAVGDVVDEYVTTDEERMEGDREMAKIQLQQSIENRKLDIKEQTIYLQDTQSARQMQAQVQTSDNAGWLAKNIGPLMAIITTLLTFALFFWVISGNEALDGGKKDIVLYILGALSAVTTQIFSFYFGSSQGSADKNKLIQ